MKITRISQYRLDMPLAVPYTIAYETVSHSVNIVLRIDTDKGLTGWGCAAPDPYITGETPEQVETVIASTVSPLLTGERPFRMAWFNQQIRQAAPGASSTLAAVDMALYDLLARQAGVPLYQLLGGYRDSMPTSITIGIMPLADTLEEARRFLGAGFTTLKLKGGLNVEEDVERVLKLRETLGYGFALRFDANQGYSVDNALAFMKGIDRAKLEIFEQPSPQAEGAMLGSITRGVNVPVMADESIRNLLDAYHLVSNDLIDMVNIKLMKVGGLLEAQHINSVARAAGMEVMVGCLDECALGISGGLHFALSRPNVEYADLDGHLDLLNDPFQGLFTLKAGILYPADAPGLGPVKFG